MADHWRWAYASSRDREQPGAEACGSASSSQWRPQGCVVSGGAAQPTAKGTTSLVLRRPLGAESRPCGQTRRSTGTRVVVPCDAWASSEHVVRCRLSQRGVAGGVVRGHHRVLLVLRHSLGRGSLWKPRSLPQHAAHHASPLHRGGRRYQRRLPRQRVGGERRIKLNVKLYESWDPRGACGPPVQGLDALVPRKLPQSESW